MTCYYNLPDFAGNPVSHCLTFILNIKVLVTAPMGESNIGSLLITGQPAL